MKKQENESDTQALALAGDLRVLVGKLRRRLRDEANLGDFTSSQTSALSRLERDGSATITSLARAEGMRPQSMGAVIAALEAAGLVSGEADPADGRQTLWSLTPTCRELVKNGRAAKEDWLFRTIQAKLKPAEQQELANAIELIARLAES